MRLRDRMSLRPPMRYNSDIKPSTTSPHRARVEEHEQTGGAQWSSRYSRGPTKLPIKSVDFDPNLPPAAFPSLEYPHPPSREENGESELGGLNLPVTSNGPQNSLNVEDTNLMNEATVSHSSDSDCDRDEDVDMLDTESFLEESRTEDPKWCDLAVALQVEIFFNMSEIYGMQEIQDVLGLDNNEVEEVERNLTQRTEMNQFEDDALEKMRQKQLDMLLSCDYSNLQKQPVPNMLAMTEKYWDRYYNMINKHCGTQFTMCQTGDLRLARCFLSKRGVPLIFAGGWGNGYVSHAAQSGKSETNTIDSRDPYLFQPDASSSPSEGTTALDSTPNTSLSPSPHAFIKSSGEVQRFSESQKANINPFPQLPPKGSPIETSQRGPQEEYSLATGISTIDPRRGMNSSRQAGPFPYTDLNDIVTRSVEKRVSIGQGNLQVTSTYKSSLWHWNASSSQSSESASNLPLPRRLVPYPSNFRYPLQPSLLFQQAQMNIKDAGGGRAAMPQMHAYGQKTDGPPCEDMFEPEACTAAQIDNEMMQPLARIASRLPILTPLSVSDSIPNSATADPGTKNADEEKLSALFDFDAYTRAHGGPRGHATKRGESLR